MILPRIGITLGDPGGIGPEITLKAISQKQSIPIAHYILFGSSLLVEREKQALGIKLDITPLTRFENPSSPGISLYEIECSIKDTEVGISSKENGKASFLFFKEAVKAARKGKIHSLVTSPISKKSWSLAGVKWNGHTDYLSQLNPRAIMTFWSKKIKIALLSAHVPLKSALNKIKKENLLDFFFFLHQCLEKFFPGKFHYLVAGLNPHAGEDGLLGSDETQEIIPAIKEAQREGMRISGPYPPDTVFRESLDRQDRVVIALYHDQGLIPFKLEAFDNGVNLTLGLPFTRTSPDHGTAFDIAGQGKANPQSMIEAIRLAYEFSSKI